MFVNSMSDLFHEDVPDEFIAQVFDVMNDERCQQHTFQVLTKRPERIEKCLWWCGENWPGDTPMSITLEVTGNLGPNIWLGVSVEDQATWDERVELLGLAPAAVRFVSAEPLLDFIDTGNSFDPPTDGSPYRPIDWLIIGGESGPKARPCNVEWVRSLVSQCKEAGVACFVKQDSGPRAGMQGRIPDDLWTVKEYPK